MAVDAAFTEAPDPVASRSPAFTPDVVERALLDASHGTFSAKSTLAAHLQDFRSNAPAAKTVERGKPTIENLV